MLTRMTCSCSCGTKTATQRSYGCCLYSELSGAQLNRGKSRALRFSAFVSDLARGRAMEWVAAVKVLGMNFHASGEVVDEGWKEL